MDMLGMIQSRHSIRAFTDGKITYGDLEKIALAAIAAPSAKNRQSWQFTVVQGDSVRELEKLTGAAIGRENYGFYGADAVIITSNQSDAPFGCDDCACAMENMMLEASSLGLGSVWINQLRDACSDSAMREKLRSLGIPDDHKVYGTLALGFPAEEGRRPAKNSDVIKWNLE